jgi:Ser/Thr protein kinase RdoA (MazF antagonist)
MVRASNKPISNVDDAELSRFVQSALASSAKYSSGPVRMTRSLHDYHSSFAIERLDAEFDDGIRLQLIFKDLSPTALLKDARGARPGERYQPEREIIVYRDILAAAGLGTAACYGSLIDRDLDRYWLLLEKVAGDELHKIGDFAVWCDVARCLARMHSQFAQSPNPYRSHPHLLQYDEPLYSEWIARAEMHLAKRKVPPSIKPAEVSQLVHQCRSLLPRICNLPATLIHGEFYPSNILVAKDSDHSRICPIDWETAGIGPGLLDLAAFASGRWTEQQSQNLARAYFDATDSSHPWNDFEQFAISLLECRLLVAIAWLGWTPDWQPPAEHRHDWFADALLISRQLKILSRIL